MDNALGTVVTSYPHHNSGANFVEALRESYEEITKVLIGGSIKDTTPK